MLKVLELVAALGFKYKLADMKASMLQSPWVTALQTSMTHAPRDAGRDCSILPRHFCYCLLVEHISASGRRTPSVQSIPSSQALYLATRVSIVQVTQVEHLHD